MNSNPTFVSLYSGAGGLDVGFARAGFRPVFSNDIDADALATNRATMAMLAQELPHLDARSHIFATGSIRDVDLPSRGAADFLIGGPPCQGFSVAGRMDPDDPRSKHVFDFLAAVRRLDPEAFVMENVKALAANNRWSGIITELRRRAERLGYDTALFVLNASDFGVPQARERMFLIGTKSTQAPDEPKATVDAPRSLRDALRALPEWGAPGNDSICNAIVTPARNPVLRRSPWAGMLFNGQGRPMNLESPAPTLPASMGGNRTPIVDQQHIEDPTVLPWVVGYHAKLWKGSAPVKRVPRRLRRITVEEASAIQTFPTNTPWVGPQSSKYRQIGNAVPPGLAFAVATHLLAHYRGQEAQERALRAA